MNLSNVIGRRLQQRGIGRRYRNGASAPGGNILTPSRIAWANEMMRWADEFICQPHPMLGRKGPVCPFMQKTMRVDRYLIALHDEVRDPDVWRLRDIVFSHAEGLKKNFPETDPEGAFTGLVIVFPLLPASDLGVLDELHSQLKSDLMAHDVMLSPFYAKSVKPSISNPEFHVFQSPLPCFVLRHVDVRDIVFLGNNPLAFARYHARFAEKFRDNKVSNEFGYVDRYNEAKARYSVR